MKAPFPYFGGKSAVVNEVWSRLGAPAQYIEPFCGSAAMLLAKPKPAQLEIVCDMNGFIANFWRAVKHQPDQVAYWADYPVSHIDLGARHQWLMKQRPALGEALQDSEWPGDAKVAGYWLWGQCCWIGSGWCEWDRSSPARVQRLNERAGEIEAIGQIPQVSDAGRGVQAVGKVPHVSDAGRGEITLLTSAGLTAWDWLRKLADRIERVRIIHGSWERCLNHHFGGIDTAVFFDPPYRAYEKLYGVTTPIADAVEAWAKAHPKLRIALCGHIGDYDLPGWEAVPWSRGRLTYGGFATTDKECIWYSPACLPKRQSDLFMSIGNADLDNKGMSVV